MSEPSVLVEMRDGTALVTLNRPARRNALDLAMRDGLAAAVDRVRDDDAIKAIVITGASGTFCAGGDLKALRERDRNPSAGRDRIRRLHRWFHELVNLEKPVVAAVDGAAYGAGFNLALAADFILCSPQARFCQVFGRVGLVPDLGGFFLLPRIVGLQRAKELVFSAREIGPEEALSLGIVYAIRPAETLTNEALALAERFHQAPTGAIGMAKNILNQSFHLDQRALAELEAYAQAVALSSDYAEAAMARFLAKAPPLFDWPNDKSVARPPASKSGQRDGG